MQVRNVEGSSVLLHAPNHRCVVRGRRVADQADAACMDRLHRGHVTDVFDLDETVIDRYRAFARPFARNRSPKLNAKVVELYAARRFWHEPLIQLIPHYADGGSNQDARRCFGISRAPGAAGMERSRSASTSSRLSAMPSATGVSLSCKAQDREFAVLLHPDDRRRDRGAERRRGAQVTCLDGICRGTVMIAIGKRRQGRADRPAPTCCNGRPRW